MRSDHQIVSLSLGTIAEPSALVVVEPSTKVWHPKDGKRDRDSENHFNVTWLERFPAGRPIPAVVARVCEVVSDKRLAKKCTVLLDITSTGLAPRRVFESRGLYPDPIDLINTGAEEYTKGTHRVPLRDVIGSAQVLLQPNRLKVADALELAETLLSDLQAFDPKPIERNSDLRGGRNADLVVALAVALWWGDKLTWADDVGRRRYEPKDTRVSHWVA